MTTRDLGITFAGGGNRAFYQLGLLNRWGDWLLPRVAAVATCSAGACVVLMYLTARRAEARTVFQARTRGLVRNLDWRRVLRGERLAPHGDIYRDILDAMFADGGFERVREQAFPVYVLASAFPERLPGAVATTMGIAAYQAEKAMRRGLLHPTFGRALGFEPLVVDARTCETADELTSLVMASSATPPFTPLGLFRARRLLDGGMIDNAPAFVAEAEPAVRRNLVILTRPYPPGVIGRQGNRLYLAPTAQPPVSRWDYTQPHLLEDTVDMGEQEADVHRPAVEAFLDEEGLGPGG
jgi:predicted acylesterase/phospholipase RssA